MSGVVAAAGCGKPRVEGREGRRWTTLGVNLAVGIMQLFTVPLLLVGWIWSLVWGIYFVILAGKFYKPIKRDQFSGTATETTPT